MRSSLVMQALTRHMLEEISELVEKGALSPLPFRSFPACRVDSAFRLMAQGKHIGKVVVAFPEAFLPRRGEPLRPAFAIKPEGCYLITGAFGGFGKVLAEWLVEGRCASPRAHQPQRGGTPEAEAFVQKPSRARRRGESRAGGHWLARRCRHASSAEIRSGDQPLKGLFHLAMVIDDAPLAFAHPRAVPERDGAEGAMAHGLLHEAHARI